MRENYLSMSDISKMNPGFKFYTKNKYVLLELVSIEEKMIHVAHGILGDKYQKMITINVIDSNGNQYSDRNLTHEMNNGNIYTIAYIEKDWNKLDYVTIEYGKKLKSVTQPMEEETQSETKDTQKPQKLYEEYLEEAINNRNRYKSHIEEIYKSGDITKLEMYKNIAESYGRNYIVKSKG